MSKNALKTKKSLKFKIKVIFLIPRCTYEMSFVLGKQCFQDSEKMQFTFKFVP